MRDRYNRASKTAILKSTLEIEINNNMLVNRLNNLSIFLENIIYVFGQVEK